MINSNGEKGDCSNGSKMTQINVISNGRMADDSPFLSQTNNGQHENLSASKFSNMRPAGADTASPRRHGGITSEKSQHSKVIDLLRYNSEEHQQADSQTPKTIRQRGSFIVPDGINSNTATSFKNTEKKKVVNRQLTMKQQQGVDGYQVSLTDVVSIGTKHRASFTQTQMSNNDLNMNSHANAIGNAQLGTAYEKALNGGGQLQSAYIQVPTTSYPAAGQSNMRQSKSYENAGSVPAQQQIVRLQNLNNEHIISIFDKDNEKSYLLERQVFLSPGTAGEHDQNAPSIFKVQEVGTAKFKCLPVTDYGKIMNIHRQRQQRKIQTADGSSRRTRNSQNTNGHRRGRSMAVKTGNATGITSAETFHVHGKYKTKFQSQNTANLHHQHAKHAANAEKEASQKLTAAWMQRQASADKNCSLIVSTNQLRNSKSTANSGQRKEVFSKTKFVNDKGISITQRTAFKPQAPLSATQSKASAEHIPQGGVISGYFEDQNVVLKGINSVNNFSSSRTQRRMATARTNVVRPIYIDKLTTNPTTGGPCCCPSGINTAEHNSAVTIGSSGLVATPLSAQNQQNILSQNWQEQTQHSNCQQHQQYETLLTSSHRGGTTTTGQHQKSHQERKYLKKRAQSQGGVRMQNYQRGSDHCTLNTVNGGPALRNNQSQKRGTAKTTGGLIFRQMRNAGSSNTQTSQQLYGVGAKLMSIASDLRKNILPKQHEQINEIYKQRISNYLSLLAIHGEPNRNIVNNIFNASCSSNGGNIDEEILNELLDQIKRQQQKQQVQLGQPSLYQRQTGSNAIDQQLSGHIGLAEEGSAILNDLDLVDNVRPLRNKIIETVRGLPSYYEGRIKKDPIKLKQFEMTMNSNTELPSAAMTTHEAHIGFNALNEQQLMDVMQFGGDIKSLSVPMSVIDGGQANNLHKSKTLKAAISETRQKMLLLNNRANFNNDQQAAAGRGKDDNKRESEIISRNKQNMMVISANEVDRMLYKKGLASPTVERTCHNEMMRRAWANRRVSMQQTKLTNVQALIREHPPLSPLVKPKQVSPKATCEQDKAGYDNQGVASETGHTLDSAAKKNLDQMLQSRNGAENQNANGAPGRAIGTAIRKSLMLSQVSRNDNASQDESDKDDYEGNVNSVRHNYDSNLTPMDESESFIHLVPKQNQLQSETADKQRFGLQNGRQFGDQSSVNNTYLGGQITDPYQSFGMARPSAFNDPQDGGQDLTHILNNKTTISSRNGAPLIATNGQLNLQDITDLMIKGTAPQASPGTSFLQQPSFHSTNQGGPAVNTGNGNIESQKMVKTYEFHLPMHHIREEEQRSQAELYASSSKYKAGIGGLQNNQASTNNVSRYNLSKQSTVNRISKKKTAGLLPNGGKRDDISSQMLENETLADQQNSLRNLNLIGSSMYGEHTTNLRINMSQTAIRKGKSQTQNRSQNPAAQSFEANEEASSLKKRVAAGLVSQSIDMTNQAIYQQKIASREEQMESQINSNLKNAAPKKQALSNLTTRNGASPGDTSSTRRKANMKRAATNKNASIAARNSPLICLSQQELNEKTNNKLATENTQSAGQSDQAAVTFQQVSSYSRPGKIQLHSLINQTYNSQQQQKQSNRGSKVSRSPHSAKRNAAVRTSKESWQSAGRNQQNQAKDTGAATAPTGQMQQYIRQKGAAAQRHSLNNVFNTTINHSEHAQPQKQTEVQQTLEHQEPSQEKAEENVDDQGEEVLEQETVQVNTPMTLKDVGTSETDGGGSSGKPIEAGAMQLGSDDRQTRTAMRSGMENEEETSAQDAEKQILSRQYSPQPPEAYLIVHSSDGQSEVLEIAQRNFELFGGKQLDSGAKLTGSSIATSDAARCTLAAVNSKDDVFMSGTGEFRLDVGEHQIEVINISQAVQTSSNPNVLQNSSRDYTPNISNMFVTRNSHTPTNISLQNGQGTQQQVSKPLSTAGAESRLRYIERLLSGTESGQPRQTQVKMQQFQTKLPKRQTKSATGYPAVNRIQKQFRNPGFKQAQLFMPHAGLKAVKDEQKQNLLNELNGRARFKTFRANNELYMRIDTVKDSEGGAATMGAPMSTDPNEIKAYNALLENLQRNSLPGGHNTTTINQTSTGSARNSLDRDKLELDQSAKAYATRASQFNTLEFHHKPECPLHELEAFEAQEGIWADQSNNLVIQDHEFQAVESKTVDQGNKVVFRKQSQNNSIQRSGMGSEQNNEQTIDYLEAKAQASSGEDLSQISKHKTKKSPDTAGQTNISRPAAQAKKAKGFSSTTTPVSQPKHPEPALQSEEAIIRVQNDTMTELAQMNDTLAKQVQSPSRVAAKQVGYSMLGSRPTSIITQPVLRHVNKLSKVKKNSMDVEVKAARAPLQANSVPLTPQAIKASQQSNIGGNPTTNFVHQTAAPHPQQSRALSRGKSGVKDLGHHYNSGKHQSNQTHHEFEVLGTNPASFKSNLKELNAKKTTQFPNTAGKNNRTINVPQSYNRHIDVSEFSQQRENESKSPGLAAEGSVANQDLNFSLGIETQNEGNVQDNSHSQIHSRTSTPLTKNNAGSQKTLDQKQPQPMRLQIKDGGQVQIGTTETEETPLYALQQTRGLSKIDATGSKATVDEDEDQECEMRANDPMKAKRTWRGKPKKLSAAASRQDKQLRLTNMVLQNYADKQHNLNRRPFYSTNQFVCGSPSGQMAAASGILSGVQMQKRGSNQDIPFELNFNTRQSQRSKTNSNANKQAYKGSGVTSQHESSTTQHLAGLAKLSSAQESVTSSLHDAKNDKKYGSKQAKTAKNDPEVLKNMLNSRAAPVIVPRQNDGFYQGTNRQGLDRAINYINYDSSQRTRMNIHEPDQANSYPFMVDEINQESADQLFYQQQDSSSLLQMNHHADGGITAGFGSLDSSYNGAAGAATSNMNTQRSQHQGSFQLASFEQMGSLGRENFSQGTVGFNHQQVQHLENQMIMQNYILQQQNQEAKLDAQGQPDFGSMICGMPCLEPTSLNQAHLQKYKDTILSMEISNELARQKQLEAARLNHGQTLLQTTLALSQTPQSYPSITYQEMVNSSQREIENLKVQRQHQNPKLANMQASAYKIATNRIVEGTGSKQQIVTLRNSGLDNFPTGSQEGLLPLERHKFTEPNGIVTKIKIQDSMLGGSSSRETEANNAQIESERAGNTERKDEEQLEANNTHTEQSPFGHSQHRQLGGVFTPEQVEKAPDGKKKV